MSEFTKGPWEIEYDNYGEGDAWEEWYNVGPASIDYTGHRDIMRADAILISAAPDMYEALTEFVAWVEVSQEHGTIKLSTSSQAYLKATAALAKADGK